MQGYQLKIIIKNSKPPIWRRTAVPGDITFGQLHRVIQAVYGWKDSKPYIFEIPQKKIKIGPAEDQAIAPWLQNHKWIRYTYGSENPWEHRVEIEKEVDDAWGYPRVEKYKGANLPEDCGGIAGYYELQEKGMAGEEEYSLEMINQYLAEHLDFHKNSGTSEDTGEYTMERWLMEAHPEELEELAELNHLASYKNLTKEELTVRLKELLLNEAHMSQLLLYAGADEYRVFLELTAGGRGGRADLNFVYRSRLLRSCCILTRDTTLVVPEEVKALCRKIITPEFEAEHEGIETLRKYCSSACYLYGVTPVSLLTKLYNQYEGTRLTEEIMENRCRELMNNGGPVTVINDSIVANELLEQDAYRMLLLLQGTKPYYIPPVRGLFLQYGVLYGEAPDQNGLELIRYVREDLDAGQAQANSYFYEAQALIHKNYEMEDLIAAAAKYNITPGTKEQMAGLSERLRSVWNHTRRLGDRGYTPLELEILQKKAGLSSGAGKPGPVQKCQKIYPNDPCPCGSGRKYKKCCGR